VPKFWEGTQCECASVATFFSWSFLHPNSERVPNVNAAFFTWPFLNSNCQCAPYLWGGVAAGYFCAQILKVHPMWMRRCWRIFYLTISALKLSQCAQSEWAGVATFFSGLFLCPNFQCSYCQFAGVAAFSCGLFLWLNSKNVADVNTLVLPHFVAGYVYTQNFRVRPMWMRWYCRIF